MRSCSPVRTRSGRVAATRNSVMCWPVAPCRVVTVTSQPSIPSTVRVARVVPPRISTTEPITVAFAIPATLTEDRRSVNISRNVVEISFVRYHSIQIETAWGTPPPLIPRESANGRRIINLHAPTGHPRRDEGTTHLPNRSLRADPTRRPALVQARQNPTGAARGPHRVRRQPVQRPAEPRFTVPPTRRQPRLTAGLPVALKGFCCEHRQHTEQ